MSKKGQEKGEEIDKILTALGKMLLIIGTIWWEGVKRLRGLSVIALFFSCWFPLFSFVLGYRYYHLRFFYWGDLMSLEMARGLVEWGRIPNGLALMGVVGGLVLFVLGFGAYCTKMRAARALSRLGIKAGMDCSPKLVKVAVLGEHRKRLTLLSEGVGIDHYTKRAKDIEAVFNAKVESIKVGRMPRFVEITLTTRAIPTVCHYQKMKREMAKVSSFVVGEGLNGTIVKSVLDFPGGHLLIAGTSGGGKSNWFKATLLSLIETTPHGEFFLLDFKGGVEFGPFRKFPNVSVEKDMEGALRKLRMIVNEMNRRFEHLEKVGRAAIVPEKDKVNHLFIAVDEASLLYGKVARFDAHFESVTEARQLTNDIAKRGRAACISLILATQKITKETIDTAIQENITGRMCFRMNTLQGSMVVLANKLAMELPDIPGRAIWQCGNEQIEVQAPLLKDRDIRKEAEGPKEQEFFTLLGQSAITNGPPSNDYMSENETNGGCNK